MPTTSQLREWWAPPCTGPFSRVLLFGEGVVSVRPQIVDAVAALDACLRAHDYRTRKADTGAYSCRQITGGTGYSLHAFATALDINWTSNPYGAQLVTDMPPAMVAAIKAIRTKGGKQVWRWGGDYAGNKDAMHFEIVCSPADLAVGIDPATVAGGHEEDDMQETDFARLQTMLNNQADNLTGLIVRQTERVLADDDSDEAEIVAGVLKGLSPEAIAAAIPADIAEKVADELHARLAG